MKISELAQGFSDGYSIDGSKRHQASGTRCGFRFLFPLLTQDFVPDNQTGNGTSGIIPLFLILFSGIIPFLRYYRNGRIDLTKTRINPLKRKGLRPGASLPLLPYKSKLLTPKAED